MKRSGLCRAFQTLAVCLASAICSDSQATDEPWLQIDAACRDHEGRAMFFRNDRVITTKADGTTLIPEMSGTIASRFPGLVPQFQRNLTAAFYDADQDRVVLFINREGLCTASITKQQNGYRYVYKPISNLYSWLNPFTELDNFWDHPVEAAFCRAEPARGDKEKSVTLYLFHGEYFMAIQYTGSPQQPTEYEVTTPQPLWRVFQDPIDNVLPTKNTSLFPGMPFQRDLQAAVLLRSRGEGENVYFFRSGGVAPFDLTSWRAAQQSPLEIISEFPTLKESRQGSKYTVTSKRRQTITQDPKKVGELSRNTPRGQITVTIKKKDAEKVFDEHYPDREETSRVYPGKIFELNRLLAGKARPLNLERTELPMTTTGAFYKLPTRSQPGFQPSFKIKPSVDTFQDRYNEIQQHLKGSGHYSTLDIVNNQSNQSLSIELGGRFTYGGFFGSADASFSQAMETTTYSLVAIQKDFSIDVGDVGLPRTVAGYFANDPGTQRRVEKMQQDALVYVGSVNYGHAVFFNWQSNKSDLDVKGALYAGFGDAGWKVNSSSDGNNKNGPGQPTPPKNVEGTSFEVDARTALNKLMKQGSLKMLVLGGKGSSEEVRIQSFDQLKSVGSPFENNLWDNNTPAVPISYELRFCKDYTPANVRLATQYFERTVTIDDESQRDFVVGLDGLSVSKAGGDDGTSLRLAGRLTARAYIPVRRKDNTYKALLGEMSVKIGKHDVTLEQLTSGVQPDGTFAHIEDKNWHSLKGKLAFTIPEGYHHKDVVIELDARQLVEVDPLTTGETLLTLLLDVINLAIDGELPNSLDRFQNDDTPVRQTNKNFVTIETTEHDHAARLHYSYKPADSEIVTPLN